jgi:hypothetical protein
MAGEDYFSLFVHKWTRENTNKNEKKRRKRKEKKGKESALCLFSAQINKPIKAGLAHLQNFKVLGGGAKGDRVQFNAIATILVAQMRNLRTAVVCDLYRQKENKANFY